MPICPHCPQKLDYAQLECVMKELSKNAIDGEVLFRPACCGKEIRAYSNCMSYFIESSKAPGGAAVIGEA